MPPPYVPGRAPPKWVHSYNDYQQALWDIFDLGWHGHYFGFEHTLQPSPWQPDFDETAYVAWKDKFWAAWKTESGRDKGTRAMEPTDYPEHLMREIYQCMMAAKVLKKI